MKAFTLFAAAATFAVAGSAFAADTPAAAAAATSIAATSLNVPAVTISSSTGPTRAEVQAEAVEFVKNHKTALAIQLEQYKN